MEVNDAVKDFIDELSTNGSSLFPYMANSQSEFNENKDTVYYSGPFWDREEIVSAIDSLLTGKWLSSGEKVNQFERQFSKKFNGNHSVMTNSGSSANLIMVGALKEYFGWADNDEIIVSVVGFPTTTSSILQNNLKPIFVDISWQDLNWDYSEIESRITSRTRALFFSPVLGNPGEFDRIIELCESYNLKLILDNCDSLGSKWKNVYLNEYAVASSCSFYPAHHITTMEGGMVTSKIEEIVTIARSLAWWGRGCYCVGRQNLLPNGTCKKRFDTWIPECDYKIDHKYLFDRIGYNLKPLDLQGAIGLSQLSKFDKIHILRRQNKESMDLIFSGISGLRKVEETLNSQTSWFGAPYIADTVELKLKLVKHLEENRIQTRNYFAGNILMQPGYSHLGDWKLYPNASKVLGKVFFVGVSPTITKHMIEYVDKIITKFILEVKK